MILSPAQLRDLAARVGFPDPALAAAVAMAESYGHTDAENIVPPSRAAATTTADPGHPVGPEWSVGIWQINNCARWQGDACASVRHDRARLLDPTYNAQVAYELWQRRGWNPWGGYTNGGYRQYLPAGYSPPAPVTPPAPAPVNPFPGVTPPARPSGASGVIVAATALVLTAAAGFAVYQGRAARRVEPPPEPEPFVYP